MKYEKPSEAELKSPKSETARYRHLTAKYCYTADGEPGCGVDLASQGDSVVPWAFGFDLPQAEFDYYCSGEPAKGPIQLRGKADKLPFDDKSLDFVYCSHLLEDYLREDWTRVVSEWVRVVKPGGYIIILVPERERWAAAIARGQCPNCSHAGPEPVVGDIRKCGEALGLEVIEDDLTDQFENDYSILGVLKVPCLPSNPA